VEPVETAGSGRWRRSPWVADAAVVAIVGLLTAADLSWNTPGTRAADGVTYALLAGSLAALLLRRRWPVAVAAGCGAATTGWLMLGHRGELLQLAAVVALYAVALRGNRRRTLLVAPVAVGWAGLLGLLTSEPLSAPVTEMLWPVVALLLGELVRTRRELAAEYAAGRARAAAEREREAWRRVHRERLRIAREFHDVVAHTMAAVQVQMAVAVTAFEQRPQAAWAALRQARTASRDALAELRAVVRLLREEPADGPAAPSPGLDHLDELVRGVGEAGLRVSLHRQGTAGDPPAGAQLAAYRIVQEALTNVLRHARARTATVSVSCQPDGLVVEVVDDGIGWVPSPGGYGLAGMAERAAALGGTLAYGPQATGGFRVRALLPAGTGGGSPTDAGVPR
jgi:signal transduction histidine kinase